MPRYFRLYGKKRGDRRTGSEAWGSFGEALFFGFMFTVGCTGLVLLLALVVVPEWRANHAYVETTCTVVDRRVAIRDATSLLEREPSYRPEVRIRYRADNQDYEGWAYDATEFYSAGREEKQAAVRQFEIGETYPCWYDLRNPNRVILVKGYSWWLWLLVLLPVAFIGIGGAGLVYTLLHWGKSLEHRSVAVSRAANLDVFQSRPAVLRQFPTLPLDANITNSPGTRLAYRLPINISEGWRMLSAVLATLAWNAIVVALATSAIRRHLAGEPDWLLTLFLVPFAAAGIAFVVLLVRQLLSKSAVGPTQLEISNHPLYPGESYDLYVTQTGRLNIQSFTVSLVCEEEANFRQGTDTRADRRRVFEGQIYQKRTFDIEPGTTFDDAMRVVVPANAMHSFKADHNEVQWRLVVRGEATGVPTFERSYPVIVYPPRTARPT